MFKKILFMSLSIFAVVPAYASAQTVVANDAPYQHGFINWIDFTTDVEYVGVLIYDDQGTMFKGLYSNGASLAAGTYNYTPDYFDDIDYDHCGTYFLLAQNGNTCWAGNTDNIDQCLSRGETVASTTFMVEGCSTASTSTPTTTIGIDISERNLNFYLILFISFITTILSIIGTLLMWDYIKYKRR